MLEIYGKFCLVLQRFINFALNLHLDFGADCEPKKPDIHNHVGGFLGISRCDKRQAKVRAKLMKRCSTETKLFVFIYKNRILLYYKINV